MSSLKIFRPRGLPPIDARKLDAARRIASGERRRDVAASYGVSVSTMNTWMEQVHDAAQEARNLAASVT